ICAVVNGKIIANAGINPIALFDRYAHRATFGISICKPYWGLGIGSHLLGAIIRGAREMGYEQLELEVVSENERGLALYKKYGFVIYG
ncbi:GNAT family N-acetyltransferase, partial [Clostridioides difficile]|nr:GNAT family N-acetyltransferase [Clostridioides difficile]